MGAYQLKFGGPGLAAFDGSVANVEKTAAIKQKGTGTPRTSSPINITRLSTISMSHSSYEEYVVMVGSLEMAFLKLSTNSTKK